jgi:hypothetical protein
VAAAGGPRVAGWGVHGKGSTRTGLLLFGAWRSTCSYKSLGHGLIRPYSYVLRIVESPLTPNRPLVMPAEVSCAAGGLIRRLYFEINMYDIYLCNGAAKKGSCERPDGDFEGTSRGSTVSPRFPLFTWANEITPLSTIHTYMDLL